MHRLLGLVALCMCAPTRDGHPSLQTHGVQSSSDAQLVVSLRAQSMIVRRQGTPERIEYEIEASTWIQAKTESNNELHNRKLSYVGGEGDTAVALGFGEHGPVRSMATRYNGEETRKVHKLLVSIRNATVILPIGKPVASEFYHKVGLSQSVYHDGTASSKSSPMSMADIPRSAGMKTSMQFIQATAVLVNAPTSA